MGVSISSWEETAVNRGSFQQAMFDSADGIYTTCAFSRIFQRHPTIGLPPWLFGHLHAILHIISHPIIQTFYYPYPMSDPISRNQRARESPRPDWFFPVKPFEPKGDGVSFPRWDEPLGGVGCSVDRLNEWFRDALLMIWWWFKYHWRCMFFLVYWCFTMV
jgi:hypothetical protein